VVIGSGVGGLCCGSMLARYGEDVLVLESHDTPGGAAHSFEIKGYHFDSGPSLFSGLSSRGPQANPLAQVKKKKLAETPAVKLPAKWCMHHPCSVCVTNPLREALSVCGICELNKRYSSSSCPTGV
jgi:protoporphyrinogen oxidase